MNLPIRKPLPALPSPQRSRSRRERRSDAARKPVVHVVMPGMEVARAEIKPRETISAFLKRVGWATKDKTYGWQFKKGLPTVLEVNGESVLRKDWQYRRIAANDNVRFVSFPLGGGQGGGAKQVIGLVALVAVSAFALWAGPALAGALFGGSALAGGLATAAIGIGGSLLINALVSPNAGATNAPNSTQDQIYSVQAQGNTAKLGQPLPVWYGRLFTYPDFAATPWGQFVANDQYINVLLSTGMGTFSYEALYVDQTILWDPVNGISPTFAGAASVAFYAPGETVTLFPTNVDASDEVTGQQPPDGGGIEVGQYFAGELPTSFGAPLGPFVANPSQTQASSIAIDFVFPSGCFTINTQNNNIGYANVTLLAEYAPCNDAGAATGPFSTLFEVTRQYASTSPIRDSITTAVTPGRYLVQFRRMGQNATGTSGTNGVIWAGLRSFLVGTNTFADVSTVAIQILATSSTQGSYKFGVLATRQLPVWNGSAFVTQATRNNGWAFLDAVTNSQYGSGLPISKVDFNSVVSFAAGCDTRGDTFDYNFTAAVAVPAAFDKILTPARARHFWLGDTVSIVRDEWRDVPSMLLTDREIVRDSTQVTWTMLGDEDPDAVIVEYVDETTWGPAQVQYPPDDQFFTAQNAQVQRIDGIVNRDQAFRECAFYYLQSIYRRENVQIGTEYEGRAITFGSVLRVQSELPMAYGYGGAVVGVSGDALTLDPAPVWDAGPFYIRLRMASGTYFGPVTATMGANASIANLNAGSLAAAEAAQSTTLSAVLAREDGGEYPSFELGTADSQSKLCVVLNGVPNGDLCTLNLVVDDERVHATDLGTPPVLPSTQFPSNASVPLLVGLNATFGQGTAEPMLSASWFPTAGAVYYIAEVSFDAGNSWAQIYEGQANQFSSVTTLAALTLRVQAVNSKVKGPYSSVDLEAPTIVIASQTVALASLIAGIQYQVTTLQDILNDKIDQATQQIAAIVSNQDTRNWLDKKEIRSQLFATAGTASASITELQQAAVDAATAFATYQTTVSAQFGDVNTSISTNETSIATLDGYAASQYSVTLTTDGYASGFNLVNGGPGFSDFVIVADKFQIQFPGFNGGDPVPFFTTGIIGGVQTVGIDGSLILTGTITTPMIQAGAVTTITLAAQAVTAAKVAANSITAANGAIDALAVKSLNIGDNAVTITQISTSSTPASTPSATCNSMTVSIDTTGLAGKSVSVLASWTAATDITQVGSGACTLSANGTTISTGGILAGAAITLAGAYTFTASGGTDNVSIVVTLVGSGATVLQRILSATGAKR